jgi:hypothetical protein
VGQNKKKLPELLKITDKIESIIDNEFGYIVEIRGAKNLILQYKIEHPPFKNEKGEIEPAFTGEYFIDSNNFKFYIGDCIWSPIEDKVGLWIMELFINKQLISKKTFEVTNNHLDDYEEIDW